MTLGTAIAAVTLAMTAWTPADTTTPDAVVWSATATSYHAQLEHWDDLAWCETRTRNIADSGGNFRGYYQFHATSWAAVGGTGDPLAWSLLEQTYRAGLLYDLQGSGAWPGCNQVYAPLAGLGALR